jgi:cytochrome c
MEKAKLAKPFAAASLALAFVLWSHWGSGVPVFRSHVSAESGWKEFRTAYRLQDFGEDGHFVRAVQNGYNVFYFTHKYAWRFTRKTEADAVHACASCHKAEDMAYAFVNADRFDAKVGKRVSFEERVMRCFAGPMDGFVPTLYDPTIRDLRIFARAIAHHLQLSEGALRP